MNIATAGRICPAASKATGCIRNMAIRILEFFDRIGYTRRIFDTNVLSGRLQQFGS